MSGVLLPLLCLAAWQLNRAAITRYQCENLARPALRCNGKCFLAKKIKTAAEHPAQAPPACQPFLIETMPPAADNVMQPPAWHFHSPYPAFTGPGTPAKGFVLSPAKPPTA